MTCNTGFPTGVVNMGSLKILIGEGGLKSIHGRAWGGGYFKCCRKNTCEGFHLIVKLLAISLQACKSTKNELFYTFFKDFS